MKDEFYHRQYGYAPRGQKVVANISGRKFSRTNVVAAQCAKQLIAPFAFSGSMNHSLFEGWFEEVFIKEIKEPQKAIIILDNASFHRKTAIYDMADEYGFRAVFLPPHSPDYNIIENTWATIKRRLSFCMEKYADFWGVLALVFKVVWLYRGDFFSWYAFKNQLGLHVIIDVEWVVVCAVYEILGCTQDVLADKSRLFQQWKCFQLFLLLFIKTLNTFLWCGEVTEHDLC